MFWECWVKTCGGQIGNEMIWNWSYSSFGFSSRSSGVSQGDWQDTKLVNCVIWEVWGWLPSWASLEIKYSSKTMGIATEQRSITKGSQLIAISGSDFLAHTSVNKSKTYLSWSAGISSWYKHHSFSQHTVRVNIMFIAVGLSMREADEFRAKERVALNLWRLLLICCPRSGTEHSGMHRNACMIKRPPISHDLFWQNLFSDGILVAMINWTE